MREDIEKKSHDPKNRDGRSAPTGGPEPVDPQEEMKIDNTLGQPRTGGKT